MATATEYSGPPIQFTVAGQNESEQATNLELVKPSPGFAMACAIIAEAVLRQAETTLLDFSTHQVDVKHLVDGIWHSSPPMEREASDYMLATLKKMAGLNYRDRRSRQEGVFVALIRKVKFKIRVVSQGVPRGERVALYLDWKKPPRDTLTELGMRESMQQQLSQMLRDPKLGFLLVSAKPGEGYTAAWRGVLAASDRLTRDYFVVEEKSKVEPEVINIGSVTFDADKGENAMTPIPELLLREPNVLAFSDLPDEVTINHILSLSRDHELPVYSRVHGRSAVDAVLRVLVRKPDRKMFASHLSAVVNMRLIRKLCDKCRVEFKPTPQLLDKMGLPPGRIAKLYKPFIYKPGMRDELENEIRPCPKCRGLGYRGRTGIFEFLRIDDEFRKVLIAKPHLKTLTDVAAASGHVSQKQEGILLVAKGETSLEELQRVLSN